MDGFRSTASTWAWIKLDSGMSMVVWGYVSAVSTRERVWWLPNFFWAMWQLGSMLALSRQGMVMLDAEGGASSVVVAGANMDTEMHRFRPVPPL